MSTYEATPGVHFLAPVAWGEVKAAWKKGEDTDVFRREYAEQGFDDWEAWRSVIIISLRLDALQWGVYAIANPSETIPAFRGGPFRSWETMYYGGKKTPTFAEIASTEGTDVGTRAKFNEIIAADEAETLVGLLVKREIYIVEGMHRATAIAVAASRAQELRAPVRLFLARSHLAELETIA